MKSPFVRGPQPSGLFAARKLACLAGLVLVGALAGCGNRTSTESLIASGKELSAKKEHAAALIQFKAAAQQSPDSPELRLLLGQALLNAGDVAGAELEFNRALQAKLPPAQVVPLLAKALVLQGDYKKLILTYGATTLPENEAQAALQTQIALAWGALGDRGKAEAALVQAQAAVPNYGPAVLVAARVLAGKQQLVEAAKLVDGVLARNPSDHEAWQLRGELHNANAETAAAEQAFTKAMSIDKEFIPAYQALVAMRLAKADLPGARQYAGQLRALAPSHPMTAYVDANVAFAAGEMLKARELVQRLLLVAPDNISILMLAAGVEGRLGAVAQAAAYYGKVVSLKPELGVAREGLAESYTRMGQPAKALEVLKPVLAGESGNARAMALAGDAEMRQGNAEAAERLYQRAAKLNPDNSQIQTAAIVARLTTGEPLAALGDLQSLANRTKDTFADEALFAARMKLGEFDAALAVLDSMAKKRPGLASQMDLRGRVLVAKRDFAGARAAFEQALKMDPGLFAALRNLVSIDIYEKRPDRAVDRLKAAIAANPADAMAILMLAEIKAGQGAQPAEVKQLLADAVKAAPILVEARLAQISYALKKRQFKDALSFSQDAMSAVPGNVQVLLASGRAQMQAGDIEQALSTFRKLAGATPNAAAPYLRMAEAYLASGKTEQAETSLNKALELEPENAEAQSAMVELLASYGRKRNALEYVRRLKSARPKLAYLYALEAGLHAKAKDNEAALAALREGVQKTQSSELAGRLYSLLVALDRKPEAQRYAEGWMKQNPQDEAFEYLMAVQDITRGDFRTAEARLKRVVAAYPSNSLALNNLGWVLIQNGQAKAAVPYIQRAIQLAPEAAALLDTLASALAADNQAAQALDVQKRAVDMSPEDNQLRLGLGRIALQAGDKALARTELQRLQGLGAKFPAQAEVSKLLQGL